MSFLSRCQEIDLKILRFKDFYRGQEPTFTTCNLKKDFFKQDSVELTTQLLNCCETFEFKIRNKRIYEIREVLGCSEPSGVILTKGKLRGKIRKRKSEYYIIILEGKDCIVKLRILELKEVEYNDKNGFVQKDFFIRLTKSQ
jgi:hypothetical protein